MRKAQAIWARAEDGQSESIPGLQGRTDQASTKGEKGPRIGGVDQGGAIKQLGGDRWLLEEEHSRQNGAVAGEAWYHQGDYWNHPFIYRRTNTQWRIQEAGVVTTRYRAAQAAAATEQNTNPPPPEQAEVKMALVPDDSGIGSLHAHDEREPTHAIAATPGMRTIAIKSGVLAVLSHFYGLSKECRYAFLEEFCRYCDIQPVPAGSTSEDYRLKAIPFVLKGDMGVWLSRLPEGSIRTWAEFRMIFLDRFFPALKTSALKREIT
ncbi:hypothetical protein SASPL_154117 [Salvia splendens]|uniref:Retrotransposon gag domain-containing protein n=1 Tax=Salvia splendens TaxID=180675 RepID=A0A8X8VZJ2_SALSN|nr:hypothetical protein SASPL_154117 [Salvia splendens]